MEWSVSHNLLFVSRSSAHIMYFSLPIKKAHLRIFTCVYQHTKVFVYTTSHSSNTCSFDARQNSTVYFLTLLPTVNIPVHGQFQAAGPSACFLHEKTQAPSVNLQSPEPLCMPTLLVCVHKSSMYINPIMYAVNGLDVWVLGVGRES